MCHKCSWTFYLMQILAATFDQLIPKDLCVSFKFYFKLYTRWLITDGATHPAIPLSLRPFVSQSLCLLFPSTFSTHFLAFTKASTQGVISSFSLPAT